MTQHCGATSVAASVAAQASTASHCAPCDVHTAALMGAAAASADHHSANACVGAIVGYDHCDLVLTDVSLDISHGGCHG
jgi:hypothetical protein